MKGKTSLKTSFILIALILSISASFAYSYLAIDVGFTPKAEDWLIDKLEFSNKNQVIIIHNWDSYDYVFEVYLSN